MLKNINAAVACLFFLLVFAGTEALAQSSIPTPTGVCVQNCGSPSTSTTTTRDNSAEEEARRERLRLGAAAFERGEKAFATRSYDAAIRQYQSALQYDPDNATYRRRMNEAANARYKAKTTANTQALNEAQAVATYQKPYNAGTTVPQNVYDTTKHNAELTPLVAVAAPETSASTEILNRLRIPLSLNDPKNADVKDAMNRVEYMLKYNREARIKKQWAEDTVTFEKRVAELNAALKKRNVPEVTPERMKAAYNGYLLGLREAKQ